MEQSGTLVLVDPHHDLVQAALGLVPPSRQENVVYLDVANSRRPFGLNLLDVGLGWKRDQAVENALTVLRHEFDRFWGPRMEDAFRFALLTLYLANEKVVKDEGDAGRDRQYTLLDVPPLLAERAFRRRVLQNVDDPTVRTWWTSYDDSLGQHFQTEVVNPVQTKVQRFVGSQAATVIVGQPRSTIDPRAWVKADTVVLLHTARGLVGESTAALIGGTIVNLLSLAVRERATWPKEQRTPVHLLIDEAHTLPSIDYEGILGELAKYGASLTLATQSLGRLANLDADGVRDVRGMVFANIDGLFAFHVSAEDARYLAPELGGEVEVADLVELEVAVVALENGMDPMVMAQARRLRQGDLLRRLPRLPHDLALYRLLAAVAASEPNTPTLLGWQAPWQLSSQRRSATIVTVRASAWACLRWGKVANDYILIADLGGFPLRRYWRLLQGLVEWRHVQGGVLPLLVVGTVSEGRASAWRQLLVEAGRAQRDSAVECCVVTCAQVEQGEVEIGEVRGQSCRDKLPQALVKEQASAQNNGKTWNLRSLQPSFTVEKPGAKDQLAELALTLTAVDRELLDVVACHPFLSAADLAEIMNWTAPWARRQCDRLVTLGALRQLTADEVGKRAATGGRLEVTRVALRLLAEQRGMTLAEATHWLGYVGGGPHQPIGVRPKLVQVLDHTLGANGVFVGLYRAAHRAREEGRDERLVVWRSAAPCGQGMIRPDGYGVYAVAGERHSF